MHGNILEEMLKENEKKEKKAKRFLDLGVKQLLISEIFCVNSKISNCICDKDKKDNGYIYLLLSNISFSEINNLSRRSFSKINKPFNSSILIDNDEWFFIF